ncbi:hypothetical protein DFP72DRAFT_1059325 [Ephemerocybe angulata]|uniref:Uncharacterized protein n=1 Tax=Ephemerocybe angulata TaxID=980116 RepID=A0A8H6IF15_9AGAR|nr:hypothetical protein DFP72DRAFT_1059325 [Tulosesus angulatus]
MKMKLELTLLGFLEVSSAALSHNVERDTNYLFGEPASPVYNSRLAPRLDPICSDWSLDLCPSELACCPADYTCQPRSGIAEDSIGKSIPWCCPPAGKVCEDNKACCDPDIYFCCLGSCCPIGKMCHSDGTCAGTAYRPPVNGTSSIPIPPVITSKAPLSTGGGGVQAIPSSSSVAGNGATRAALSLKASYGGLPFIASSVLVSLWLVFM